MSELKERTAYLRGLLEGSEFPQNGKEKIVWDGLLNLCEEIADNLDELEESHNEFAEYVEAIDEDLGVLEKHFYNTAEDDEDSSEVIFSSAGEDDDIVELVCPKCEEELYFTDESGDYEVICPECGEVVWSHFAESVTPHQVQPDVL